MIMIALSRLPIAKTAMFFLWGLLSFFTAHSTFANVFEMVTATGAQGGDAVWKVVRKSNRNDTELEPGIYVRGPKQTWDHALIRGNVLGRENSSGLMQLNLSKSTSRLEAWAVVDGKIVLFHVGTTPDDTGSYIVLGDERSPLIDPLQPVVMNSVNIPPIRSLDDVTVSIQEPNGYPRGQSIMFSLKNPYSPYKEMDGLSFVMRLQGGDHHYSVLDLEYPATLLDFRFHNLGELEDLTAVKGFYSVNYFSKIGTEHPDDPLAVKVWKRQLRENAAAKAWRTLPYFSLEKQSFVVPDAPKLMVSKYDRYSQVGIENIFSLEGKPPKIKLESRRGTKELFGEVNFYPNKVKDASKLKLAELANHCIHIADRNGYRLLYMNRELHLLKNNHYDPLMVTKISKMPIEGELPEEIHFEVVEHKDDHFYLFVSAKNESLKETVVYEFSEVNEQLYLENTYSLCQEFYDNSDLRPRIYVTDKQVLFDNLTAKDTEKSYKDSYDETAAHVDIEKSMDAGYEEVGFRRPTEELSLPPRLFYHRYNNEGTDGVYDGIYFENRRGLHERILEGQLLIPQDLNPSPESESSSENREILQSRAMLNRTRITHSTGQIDLLAFAIDTKLNDGKDGFTLVFAAVHEDDKQKPVLYETEILIPFEEFTGVRFHGGQRSQNRLKIFKLGAIAAFKPAPDEEKQSVVLFDLELRERYSRSSDQDYTLNVRAKNRSLKGFSKNGSITSIVARLLSDVVIKDERYDMVKLNYGELLHVGVPGPQPQQSTFDRDKAVLDRKDFEHPAWGPIQLKIYAIDKNFEHGEKSFSLVFESHRIEGNLTDYFVKDFHFGIDRLQGLAIQTRADYEQQEDRFGLVYALSLDEKTSKRSGTKSGFHSLFFNIKRPTRNNQNLKNPIFTGKYAQLLEKSQNPSMEEIDFKLMVDVDGNFYWPENDLIPSHRMFKAVSLTTGQSVFPNQTRLRLETVRRVRDINNFRIGEGSWRVKKGAYIKANLPAHFGRLENENLDMYRSMIFDDLSQTLEGLGSLEVPHEHKVLLVSKDLKKYISNAVAASWLLKKQLKKEWSYENRNLALYYLNRERAIDQRVIYENFQAMGEALNRGEKPVLLADIADLIQVGSPKTGDVDKPYQYTVKSEASLEAADEMDEIYQDSAIDEHQESASLLYILASEGQVIPLEDFSKRGSPQNSIVMIGTEEEWQEIKSKASAHERAYGLLQSFKEMHLDTPSLAQRRELLIRILEDKERLIKGFHYNCEKIFLHSGDLSQEEIREKVVDYAVLRSQALAEEKGENVFVSYVKLMNKFKQNLSSGIELAEDGMVRIDKAFIENIMCDAYGLPLNLRSLPKDDPLRVLSRKNAPMMLNEAGYAGNFDVKMRVINGILGQTNSGDQKTIPASFVLFGKKGSGKTFLFKTLVKMLGLKYYDFSADEQSNADAQVFFVNLGNITSGLAARNVEGETMPVGKLIDEFDKFLRLPKGKRGFIIFDDAHLSSSEVRGEVFSKLRSLFEAKDGKYQGVNVRNLTLFMTFNPTIDREKIRKVVDYGEPTPLELTLATFMGDDNKVDESFFNRWGDIINLDIFGTSAKGNELVNRLSSTAKSHFNLENSYFTVTPDVVTKIVNRFPKLNARDFLSSTVKSLSGMLRHENAQRPLYMIVPREKLPASGDWDEIPYSRSTEPSSEEVASYINGKFYPLPIYDDMRGYVYFLEMITNNFRISFYRDLIAAINGNPEIASNTTLQKYRLSPVLQALKAHLMQHPKIPLAEFSIDQHLVKKHLRITQTDSTDTYIYDMYKGIDSEQYFPDVFRRSYKHDHVADYLIGQHQGGVQQPSRLNLVQRLPGELKPSLESYLMKLFFVNSKYDLQLSNIRSWALSLPSREPQNLAPIADYVVKMMNEFSDEFFSNMDLIENMQAGDYLEASTYDVTRLFLYVLDRGMTQVSWEYASIYLIKVLDLLSQDMSIATNPGVQFWLFEAGKTLIRPQSYQTIYESIKSSLLGIGEWDEKSEVRFEDGFYSKLDGLFYDQK